MNDAPHNWDRIVAHADMDSFYAAVEQLDDPSLRGRPVLVGPESNRGVVLTASYEARPFGVGSAMPMARARKLCPDALVVPPRFKRYREVSGIIMAVFSDFAPVVEPLSLDEAFLEMTGSEGLFGGPEAMGRQLKEAVSFSSSFSKGFVCNFCDGLQKIIQNRFLTTHNIHLGDHAWKNFDVFPKRRESISGHRNLTDIPDTTIFLLD